MDTIIIRTTEGDRPVVARRFGAWAVHRPYDGRKGWSISHVRTGLCIPPFYTEDLSMLTAIKVAKALHSKFSDPLPEHGEAMAKLVWRVALGGKP